MFRGGAAGGGGVETYALVMAGEGGRGSGPSPGKTSPSPSFPSLGGRPFWRPPWTASPPWCPRSAPSWFSERSRRRRLALTREGPGSFLEPLGRDTAGAVLLGLAQALREGVRRLLVLPADHYVGDEVLVVPKDRAREVRELVRLLESGNGG